MAKNDTRVGFNLTMSPEGTVPLKWRVQKYISNPQRVDLNHKKA